MTIHPERPGVVRHQDVDFGPVGRFRDETDPGAAEQDRLSPCTNGGEALEDLRPREAAHRAGKDTPLARYARPPRRPKGRAR